MSKAKPSEILTQARAIVAVPEQWTQGDYAKGPSGRGADPGSDQAVCWCALGAVLKATDDLSDNLRTDNAMNVAMGLLSRAAMLDFGVSSVAQVNDQRGHEAVLAMFDKAIELARAQEASHG